MDGVYNKRTYAIIPTGKVPACIKSPTEQGRLSLDKNFLIWDEAWNPETLRLMEIDPDIKLLTHKQALELMSTEKWVNPIELGS